MSESYPGKLFEVALPLPEMCNSTDIEVGPAGFEPATKGL